MPEAKDETAPDRTPVAPATLTAWAIGLVACGRWCVFGSYFGGCMPGARGP